MSGRTTLPGSCAGSYRPCRNSRLRSWCSSNARLGGASCRRSRCGRRGNAWFYRCWRCFRGRMSSSRRSSGCGAASWTCLRGSGRSRRWTRSGCRSCRNRGSRLRRSGWARRLRFRRCSLHLLGFSRSFLRGQAEEMLPHELGMGIVDRARVRLLLGNADFWQVLDQDLCLDLEFPGQLIDSDLIRICHQPLSLQSSLKSTSLRHLLFR